MSSLTETAYHTRRIINFTLIGIIAYICLKIAWTIASNYYLASHPPLPPPPNMAYGKLPLPFFPEEGKKYQYSFKLETATGDLPESSPSAKVYFMPIVNANLLSLDRATEKAKLMGFTNEPLSLSQSDYLWSDPQNPLRSLTINIVNGNIALRYDFREDQLLFQDKNLPADLEAINEAKTVLSTFGLAKDDLLKENAKIIYLRFAGGKLEEAGSLSEADFVRVQFNRSKLDDFFIFTPSKDLSPEIVTFSGSQDSAKRIIELDYNYQTIDPFSFATYPIKTPSVAFEELKAGKGYIADHGNFEEKQKTIRNIYLAFYDSLKIQTYLEPIYVFEGDNHFQAFVSAIDDLWLESSPK